MSDTKQILPVIYIIAYTIEFVNVSIRERKKSHKLINIIFTNIGVVYATINHVNP